MLFPTPLGQCGIAWRGDTVVATQLPEQTPAATATRLTARTDASPGNPPATIQRAVGSITQLFEGAQTDLSDIACDLSGVDPFSVKVYNATRAVCAGSTVTYGDIASQLGNKQFAQRVGRVLGLNPIPIIIPCHRVIGANQKLTGFSAYGGIETKMKMLAIEGGLVGETQDLFSDL